MSDNTEPDVTTEQIDAPTVTGQVDVAGLVEFVDHYADGDWTDYEELAENLAPLLEEYLDLDDDIDLAELLERLWTGDIEINGESRARSADDPAVDPDVDGGEDDYGGNGYGGSGYGDSPGGGGGGEVVGLRDRVEETVRSETVELEAQIAVLNAEIENLREDLDERRMRTVGARHDAEIGAYHASPYWGLHFVADRAYSIREVTVDAAESGTLELILAEYDGADRYEPVTTHETDVEEGKNYLELDMHVPEGEYVLTRPSDLPLRRAPWDGWGRVAPGLEFVGGAKPDYIGGSDQLYDDNQYYYYFFDIRAAPAADRE